MGEGRGGDAPSITIKLFTTLIFWIVESVSPVLLNVSPALADVVLTSITAKVVHLVAKPLVYLHAVTLVLVGFARVLR